MYTYIYVYIYIYIYIHVCMIQIGHRKLPPLLEAFASTSTTRYDQYLY